MAGCVAALIVLRISFSFLSKSDTCSMTTSTMAIMAKSANWLDDFSSFFAIPYLGCTG